MAHFLNLHAIEAALHAVQRDLASINLFLTAEEADFSDIETANMLAGFALVDHYLAQGIELFSLGHSHEILELNKVILFGDDANLRKQRHPLQLKAAEKHFYEKTGGGIGDMIEYYQRLTTKNPWERAAAIFVRMQAHPQLFIEGNHRTGTLLVSFILARAGLPPFVLQPSYADRFFNPFSRLGSIKKRSLAMFFNGGKLRSHYAQLFKSASDTRFLLSSDQASSTLSRSM